MKKLVLVILFSLMQWGFRAYSKDYVVLFKQTEVSVTSLEHGAYQTLLQTTNEKSLDDLRKWLGGRNVSIGNLWLVRGAIVNLEEEEAKKLAKEPWVHGVYMDRFRRFVSPMSDLVVKQSLKEFGDDATSLWGLYRVGLAKIKAQFPQVTGKGIRVGIIDTGIQSRHPEFRRASTKGTSSYVPVLFKDFVNQLPGPYDDHGHGTHVAGTISGNQVGLAPDVSLIVGKVFTAAGSGYDSAILQAMQWVFDPDGNPTTNDFAQIVSNSWGGDLGDKITQDSAEFEPYRLAIQAWIHGGSIPIFAAGNSGQSPNGFPGGLPEPISVGALSDDDSMAEFSSRGPNVWKIGEMVFSFLKPDVSAPGVKITSAFPGNKYASWAGTSMATPHVSGSVALLLSANHKLKFADVKDLLLRSSEKKTDIQYGFGILNAYQLLVEGTKRN